MNGEFKNFLHILLAFIVGTICIAASAGSMNFGVTTKEYFYLIVGILNLGWLYPVIRQAIKYVKKSHEG